MWCEAVTKMHKCLTLYNDPLSRREKKIFQTLCLPVRKYTKSSYKFANLSTVYSVNHYALICLFC